MRFFIMYTAQNLSLLNAGLPDSWKRVQKKKMQNITLWKPLQKISNLNGEMTVLIKTLSQAVML